MSDYVVPWPEVIEYFKECREQVMGEMGRAETDRKLWQAQGKMALIQELLNLPAIFTTLEAEKARVEGAMGPSNLKRYGRARAALIQSRDGEQAT
jgi:hypothetical protein